MLKLSVLEWTGSRACAVDMGLYVVAWLAFCDSALASGFVFFVFAELRSYRSYAHRDSHTRTRQHLIRIISVMPFPHFYVVN